MAFITLLKAKEVAKIIYEVVSLFNQNLALAENHFHSLDSSQTQFSYKNNSSLCTATYSIKPGGNYDKVMSKLEPIVKGC